MMFGWYPIRVSPFFMPSIKFRYYHPQTFEVYNEATEKRKEPEMKFTKTHDKQMSVPIKIAEIDLSFFTGDPINSAPARSRISWQLKSKRF